MGENHKAAILSSSFGLRPALTGIALTFSNASGCNCGLLSSYFFSRRTDSASMLFALLLRFTQPLHNALPIGCVMNDKRDSHAEYQQDRKGNQQRPYHHVIAQKPKL